MLITFTLVDHFDVFDVSLIKNHNLSPWSCQIQKTRSSAMNERDNVRSTDKRSGAMLLYGTLILLLMFFCGLSYCNVLTRSCEIEETINAANVP